MSVALAEAAESLPITETQETYAHSMRTIARMGSMAVEQCFDTQEYQLAHEAAYDDFTTHLGEMLKTDEEFCDQLDIERNYSLSVVGKRARWSATGEPMVELLERGVIYAETAAREDPRMLTQVRRDEVDLYNARQVDVLRPGEARIGVSMYPKDAMARDGESYWHDKGYRKGLAFLQYYAKTDHGVAAGSFSIDVSDERVLKQVVDGFGMSVPGDISSDEWLLHAQTAQMTSEQAQRYVREIRDHYYERMNGTDKRLSITEYIHANDSVVREYFDSLLMPMAESLHTGIVRQEIKNFTQAIMESSFEKLKPEVRRCLLRIGNGSHFDAAMAREIDGLIRYAVVEELRRGLGDRLAKGAMLEAQPERTVTYGVSRQQGFMENVIRNIDQGVQAGRSYGGCSATELAERMRNQQDSYGGMADEVSPVAEPEDKNGSLYFECHKCHSVKRREPNSWVFDACKICKADVSCGRKRPEAATRKATTVAKTVGTMTFLATKAAQPELTKV